MKDLNYIQNWHWSIRIPSALFLLPYVILSTVVFSICYGIYGFIVYFIMVVKFSYVFSWFIDFLYGRMQTEEEMNMEDLEIIKYKLNRHFDQEEIDKLNKIKIYETYRTIRNSFKRSI